MIEIDGAKGEGGGQIVRTALALSAVTNTPVTIFNIRKGRETPGLKNQHLGAAQALAALCNAQMTGDHIGSTQLTFVPKEMSTTSMDITIPTAGSAALVLQGLMIAAIHSKNPVTITIRGGSVSSKWAAPVNYIKYVLIQHLEKMNYACDLQIKKYGYYPKGGAMCTMIIHPRALQPLRLEAPGEIEAIQGISHASVALKHKNVATRQADAATKLLKHRGPTKIDSIYTNTDSPGSGIELWCKTAHTVLGADALGDAKTRAEDVGKSAAKKMESLLDSGVCCDEYAADQLLPYMALAAPHGESRITTTAITAHTTTNKEIIETFLPVKIDMHGKAITCNAI